LADCGLVFLRPAPSFLTGDLATERSGRVSEAFRLREIGPQPSQFLDLSAQGSQAIMLFPNGMEFDQSVGLRAQKDVFSD
jgi:hypothetical protein